MTEGSWELLLQCCQLGGDPGVILLSPVVVLGSAGSVLWALWLEEVALPLLSPLAALCSSAPVTQGAALQWECRNEPPPPISATLSGPVLPAGVPWAGKGSMEQGKNGAEWLKLQREDLIQGL